MVTRMITEDAVRGSQSSDKGLNGTEKTLGTGNGFNVDHVRASTKEKLSLGVPCIQSWSVRINLVHKEIVIKTEDVERRIWRVPPFEEVTVQRRWHETHLCGIGECPLIMRVGSHAKKRLRWWKSL